MYWDNTNNRLGVGTNAPTAPLTIKGVTNTGTILLSLENSTRKIIDITDRGTITVNAYNSANNIYTLGYAGAFDSGALTLFGEANANGVFLTGKSDLNNYIIPNLGLGITVPTAKAHIKGSGSTSATTSLLVQNSASTQTLKIADDGATTIGIASSGIFTVFSQYGFIYMNAGNYLGYGFSADETFTYRNASNVSQWKFSSTGNGVLNGTLSLGNGSAPVASAQLDVTSTTKGFLPPRMTTTQKNAIASPASGLILYDSTTNKLQCYNGSTWNDLF
jgi:hypothetical protein